MNIEKNLMKGYNSVKGYNSKGTDDLSKIIPLMDQTGGQSIYDQQFINDLQDRVFSMSGSSIPRLNNTVAVLQNELQQMVEKLKPYLENM